MQEKHLQTVHTLTRKTKNHEAKWNLTSADDQFLLRLHSGAILLTKYRNTTVKIELSFLDNDGKKVDSVTASDNDPDKKDYWLLLELFEAVRSDIRQTTNTIQGILSEIQSDGVIGD